MYLLTLCVFPEGVFHGYEERPITADLHR